MQDLSTRDLARDISLILPRLRRFGRALSGSQQRGDAMAVAVLEAVLTDRSAALQASDLSVHLFTTMAAQWRGPESDPAAAETDPTRKRAQERLAALMPGSREALLLHTIEGFTLSETAAILGRTRDEADALLTQAYADIRAAVTGRTMIIEDEPIIAMDIEALLIDMGHEVTGIARTRSEAVALAQDAPCDLILSDIQLADDSSGIDAVADIQRAGGAQPVVYITAFPERLLTGDGPEPAFLISKPFSEAQVQSAVSQAMFFAAP